VARRWTPGSRCPVIAAPVEQLFRAGSAVRGSRIFHPKGAVFTGRWRAERATWRAAGAEVLQPGFEHDAIVRMSRGAGLPERLPDIHGVAIRLPDVYGPGRHQDLLVNTTIDAPIVHHLLLPAPGWFSQSYTSSLPYRAGEGPRFLLGLLPPEGEPEPGPSLDGLEARVRERPIAFGLALASLEGRWERVGTLEVRERTHAYDTLRFDPWQTGGGLRPAGVLNALRKAAYRGSRRGAPVSAD
jgi:hypothetical protein